MKQKMKQILIILDDKQILRYTTLNLKQTDTHISFTDKFGADFTYHISMVKSISTLRERE